AVARRVRDRAGLDRAPRSEVGQAACSDATSEPYRISGRRRLPESRELGHALLLGRRGRRDARSRATGNRKNASSGDSKRSAAPGAPFAPLAGGDALNRKSPLLVAPD